MTSFDVTGPSVRLKNIKYFTVQKTVTSAVHDCACRSTISYRCPQKDESGYGKGCGHEHGERKYKENLPLVTALAFLCLYVGRQPESKLANQASYTFWYVLPILPGFLVFPVLLSRLRIP